MVGNKVCAAQVGLSEDMFCFVFQQKLDAEFQKRLEKNKIAAEEQTAKRRKKR